MKAYERLLDAEFEDIKRLSQKELQTALRSATREANARLKELERFGYDTYSAAYRTVQEGTKWGQGRFKASTKFNSRQARKELGRALNFLRSRTSTISGSEELRQYYLDTFGTDDKQLIDEFYKLYGELTSSDLHGTGIKGPLTDYVAAMGKYRVMDIIWSNRDKPVETIQEAVHDEYERFVTSRRDFL